MPPQLPSLETLAEAVEVAADEVTEPVDEATDEAETEEDEELPHVPNVDWQPVPQ